MKAGLVAIRPFMDWLMGFTGANWRQLHTELKEHALEFTRPLDPTEVTRIIKALAGSPAADLEPVLKGAQFQS